MTVFGDTMDSVEGLISPCSFRTPMSFIGIHLQKSSLNEWLENLKNSGATVRSLDAQVRQRWAKSLKDFPNAMAQDANNRDMPGSEIMQSYLNVINESGYVWPTEYKISP